jgi:hypothetical protein
MITHINRIEGFTYLLIVPKGNVWLFIGGGNACARRMLLHAFVRHYWQGFWGSLGYQSACGAAVK